MQPSILWPPPRPSTMRPSTASLVRFVCCLIGLAATHASSAQAPADTVIAGADLQADVDLVARAYGTLHPGLYRYQTPAEWDGRVAALRADVAGGMSQRAFYVRLAGLLAAIQCGHSYPNFFNQTPAVQARVLEATRRLPFTFRWVGDEIVVTRDLSGSGLAPGTRVVSLDGTPTPDVLARLLPLARADGANDAKRREVLSVTGAETYEAFDVYYPLVYALGDTVTLAVEGATGASRTLRLPTLSFAEREALRAQDQTGGSAQGGAGWTTRRLADSTAVLTMPTWGLYNTSWDWRAFLDSTFARLETDRVPRLVLDLRENEGGDDAIAEWLLRHLARRPAPVPGFETYVRYRRLPADLRPYADTWDRTFDDWTADTDSVADGEFYRLRRDGDGWAAVVEPSEPRFTGRVAVLVGPINSSSTFAFADAFQKLGLGPLVGRPTGGSQRGINGGAFYFFRLPHSGIEVDIPLVGYYPPGRRVDGVPDGGLTPDVEVPLTAGDLTSEIDRTLAVAVATLRQ